MGKIISFSNQKGGVGKTTTCVNMAAYLASAGKKVLLVDLDPQGNATTGLGFAKGSLKKSVYNVIIDDEEVKDNILPTELEGLLILPSNIDLAGGGSQPRVQEESRQGAARRAGKGEEQFRLHSHRLPALPGLLTINALAAADSAIIPIQSEYYALEGLSQLMNTISPRTSALKQVPQGGGRRADHVRRAVAHLQADRGGDQEVFFQETL